MKAKEADAAAQNAKRMKIIKDLLEEMVAKVEEKEKEDQEVVLMQSDDIKIKSEDEIIVEEQVLKRRNSQEQRRSSSGGNSPERKKMKYVPSEVEIVKIIDNSEEKKLSKGMKQTKPVKKPVSGYNSEALESDSRYYITLDDFQNQSQVF